MNNIDNLIERLKNKLWDIKLKSEKSLNLNTYILERYNNIPNEYLEFLYRVEHCISPDETSWLLCEGEYNGTSDIEFVWNEFENISLEAADDEEEFEKYVRDFWNNHLPIFMNVKNEYSFFAIDLNDRNYSVVYGYEPEFEEVNIIASNFEEFLELLIEDKLNF